MSCCLGARTLGKRALRMRVTDLDGRRIRTGRAAGRYLARFLSGSLWLVGFIMPAFTSKRQALHDILTETRVVVAERPHGDSIRFRGGA